jgi:HSP20 family protein
MQYYTGHPKRISGIPLSFAGGDMAVIPKDLPEFVIEFQQRLNELFDRLFTLEKKGLPGEREVVPPVDCFETADQYMVEIELPGFCREDLNLGVFRNVLILEGVKREEEKTESVNYICLERTFGRFCRTVEIPPMVDISGVKARYTKGILSVTFPKVAETSAIINEIPIE